MTENQRSCVFEDQVSGYFRLDQQNFRKANVPVLDFRRWYRWCTLREFWIPHCVSTNHSILTCHWRIQGAYPALRVEILLFWHTNFMKNSPPTRLALSLREIPDPPLCLPQWYIYNMRVVVMLESRRGLVCSFVSLVDVCSTWLVVNVARLVAAARVVDCLTVRDVTVKRQWRRLRTYNIDIILPRKKEI